jgi:outer membrane protein assembly factor BamA
MLLNYLDDALNPTRGSLTIFSCKAMIPWKSSTVSFFKLLFEHSFFIPIKRTVLGLRVRAGHIFNQDFETIMPPERFYLGGPNSLRSYQPNLAPPLGSFIDSKGKRQLVPQGGKTMGTLNIEYRFPLIWNIGMALFQDLGILAQRSLTEVVNGGRLLAGTGFGLRYHTPVGPLRFDVGFRWKRFDPDEDGYVWYLTLGQAF